MFNHRGHNHLLLKNKDVGIFEDLYINDDGTLINVLDLAGTGSIEVQVESNKNDIVYLKQEVASLNDKLTALDQRVQALEQSNTQLVQQLLVRISHIENVAI